MKKILTLCIVLMLCSFLSTATAEISLDNLITEIEVSKVDQEFDAITPISIGVFSFGAGINSTINDLETQSILLLLGYQISENLAPYVLIGTRDIDFNRTLTLNSSFGSLPLTSTDVEGDDLAFGLGARGKIAELPQQIILGYDVRYSGTNIDTSATTNLLPTIIGYPISTEYEIEQRQLEASLIASKEIKFSTIVKSLTPYIGYKFTELDMNIKSNSKLSPINVMTETNYDGNLHSFLLGCGVEITENLYASIGGSLGDEESISAKVGYKF